MAPRPWIALLLAAAVFGVYYQVHDHGFVNFDDPVYILDNPHLEDGLSVRGVLHDFSSVYHLNWHPLTSVSYRIDYALYGLDPSGYLLGNAFLHALASALLYLAFARMTGAPGRSAFVAAVFALHPLHVESVAWASERKDVLSGAFFAFTLLAYARYAETPSARRMGIVVAFLTLGLLSKSAVVTTPFVLLLLDYWPLGRIRRSDGSALPDAGALRAAIVEKGALFALSAAVSVVTAVVQSDAGASAFGDKLPLGVRVANAIHSYGVYLADTVWPVGLAAFYPHPEGGIPALQLVLAVALLVAITFAALRSAAQRPYLIVGWLWYLGVLVPMIGLVQVGQQARADRYMYLPLIGLAIAAAWGSWDLVRSRRARVGLAVAVVSMLALRSWDQVGIWRNSHTLFEHALSVTERNFKARVGLGDELFKAERYPDALDQYDAAVGLYPRWARAHLGRAGALFQMGDLESAAASYERSLVLDPDQPQVRGDLGVILVRVGRVAEGLSRLEGLVEDGEANAEVHAFLANRAFSAGRTQEAVGHFREALRRDPDHAAASNNLAWLLATTRDPGLRDPEEAVVLAERAANRDGSGPGALDTLAAAYAAAGRFPEAVRAAGEALARIPGRAPQAMEVRARLELYRKGQAIYE